MKKREGKRKTQNNKLGEDNKDACIDNNVRQNENNQSVKRQNAQS